MNGLGRMRAFEWYWFGEDRRRIAKVGKLTTLFLKVEQQM